MNLKYRRLLKGLLGIYLPYTPLLFIENPEGGDAHIDTGVKPSQSPRVILDLEQNADRIIAHGHSTSYAGQLVRSVNLRNTTDWAFTLGDQWVGSLTTTNARIRQIIEYSYTASNQTAKLIVGDLEKIQVQSSPTSDSPWNTTNFHFFKSRADNWGLTGYGRLYSSKIYSEGIIIRDFVPCILKEDGRIGMWDKVNEVFYQNEGTTPFIYGEL